MYFCPNCLYIFDIGKSSNNVSEDNRTIINKPNDIFKLLDNLEKNNINFNNYKAEFTKDELSKNKKYQKLKEDIKKLIDIIFEDNNTSNVEFKCNNCNYSKFITETTLLYQIIIEDKNINNTNYTSDDIKLMINNPLLPHDNKYICKNINCKTHENPLLKDSIFYKEKNNYRTNYICCVCLYNW
jgi:hypothetical protein